MAAILENDPSALQEALQSGVRLDVTDSHGHTPLDMALAHGNAFSAPGMVELLLRHGARPGLGLADPALTLARLLATQAPLSQLEAALQAGGKADSTMPNGFTAFLWAAALCPNPAVLEALVKAGANPRQVLPGVGPGLLHGVPEGGAVLVLVGGLGRQENVCADHAALVGVVADLAIVFAIQFLPGSVGGGRDNRLSRAPFDLGNVEMEQGQLSAFLLVSGLAHQGGNFRQGKDLFHQKKKGPFAHAAHLRGDTLHRSATGDKSVVSLLPFALGVVADAVLIPLASVLVLLQLSGGLSILFL